ncbi:hypothetical protein IFM89_004276 [Coptis chinensis]|uniref:RNase H type-1 domain-containing protein n=1 Tax=Coptis chinensis TaxID=261450 RepID=A0A835M8M8_9MAGN|nr:hypothetical protein IFM89_004276 [Coptis chinensis]
MVTAVKNKSSLVQDIWIAAVINLLIQVWKARNKMNFEDIHVNKFFMKKQVLKSIGIVDLLSHRFMRNDPLELTLMHKLNVRCRFRPSFIIKQVSWIPLDGDVIKMNMDGSSLGNLGYGGASVISRNSANEIVGVLAQSREYSHCTCSRDCSTV